MTRTVTVRVTAEDIAQGVRRDGERCAVARAVQRAGYPEASIGWHRWFPVGQPDRWAPSAWLPARAVAWIEAFDAARQVCPVTFRLPLP